MIRIEQLTEVTPEKLQELTALARELHGDERTPTAAEVGVMLKDTDTVLMVVRDDDHIIGMATLYVIQKLGKRASYLEDVIVDEKYRGQGLGKRLVLETIEKARKLGVGKISLTSRPDRVAANKLYESLGFVRRDTNVYKLALS